MKLDEFLAKLNKDLLKEEEMLDRVMRKVRMGQKLTDIEKTALSAAIDAAKEAKTDEPGALNAIMSKVAKGEKLTPNERNILSAAIDAAKKKGD